MNESKVGAMGLSSSGIPMNGTSKSVGSFVEMSRAYASPPPSDPIRNRFGANSATL